MNFRALFVLLTLVALTSAQIPAVEMTSRLNVTGSTIQLGKPVSVSLNGGNYNLFTAVVDGNCTVFNETKPGHWAAWFSMHPGQNVTDCTVVQTVASAGVNSTTQVVIATNGNLYAYGLGPNGVNHSAFWTFARPAGNQFVDTGLSSSRTWTLIAATTVTGNTITFLWKNAWTASAAYSAAGTIHQFSVYDDAGVTDLLFSTNTGLEIASCYDNPIHCQNGNANWAGIFSVTAFADATGTANIWGVSANAHPVQYRWIGYPGLFTLVRQVSVQALDARTCLFPGVFDAVVVAMPNASHILDGNNNSLWTGPGAQEIVARANNGVVTLFLVRLDGTLEIFANVTHSASAPGDYDYFTSKPTPNVIPPNNGGPDQKTFMGMGLPYAAALIGFLALVLLLLLCAWFIYRRKHQGHNVWKKLNCCRKRRSNEFPLMNNQHSPQGASSNNGTNGTNLMQNAANGAAATAASKLLDHGYVATASELTNPQGQKVIFDPLQRDKKNLPYPEQSDDQRNYWRLWKRGLIAWRDNGTPIEWDPKLGVDKQPLPFEQQSEEQQAAWGKYYPESVPARIQKGKNAVAGSSSGNNNNNNNGGGDGDDNAISIQFTRPPQGSDQIVVVQE